jgi:DNA-binding NarL/FixJ family response regulator
VSAERPLRVVIADDQASVREGLVLLLGGLPGIDVVGAAADGESAPPGGSSPSIRASRSSC